MARRKSMSKKLILTSKTGDGLLVAYLVGLSLGSRRAGVEPEAAEAPKAPETSEPVVISPRRVAARTMGLN